MLTMLRDSYKRHNFDYVILGLVLVYGGFFTALLTLRMTALNCKSIPSTSHLTSVMLRRAESRPKQDLYKARLTGLTSRRALLHPDCLAVCDSRRYRVLYCWLGLNMEGYHA